MLKMLREFRLKEILLIVLGSFVWSLTMIKSGLTYAFGMGFWGPNGHDGIWHIALSESLSKGTWEMPIFAGNDIKNYHLGFDIVLSILHKLTYIPIVNLYFQILPPILALLVGLFVYKFVYIWQMDKAKAYWATFFVYFSGSFGWILTWFRSRQIGGESLFWSQQSLSTLVNPPFALSLVFIFSGLYFLVKGLNPKDNKLLILATFLFGLLVQIKIYGGILILGGLFLAGIWILVKRRKITILRVFTGAIIVSILIFTPAISNVQSTIVFKPFWFLETMMGSYDRVGWMKFAEAMLNYKTGGVWSKGSIAYLLAFIIFIIGNMGMRVLGLWFIVKKFRHVTRLNWIDLLIISVAGAGVILPMLFVQTGTAWNTIQFFYYSLVFIALIAGISFVEIVRSFRLGKVGNMVFEVILILLLIPSTYATLSQYLPSRPPSKISKDELQALDFLAKLPDGVVLTIPFDKKLANKAINNPPRSLYLYESTAYVSALSGKSTYIEDEINLEITGYDWRKRREDSLNFFDLTALDSSTDILYEGNIDYVYIVKNLTYDESKVGTLLRVFENDEIVIYEAPRSRIRGGF